MNDYEMVISQVRRHIDNTQSKINLYFDQPPPSQSFYHPIQYFNAPTVPVPFKNPSDYTQYSNIITETYNPTFIQTSPAMISPNTEPFLSRSQSPKNKIQTKQFGIVLPPINLTNQQMNTHRMKTAQAVILKNQLQLNKLHKQKKGYEQFLQNSMVIQNNVTNYPYGNAHSSLMEKIITQKSIDDYQNERILLKFQKQAEQFKKSKSKQIKHLQNIIVDSKDLAESRQIISQREQLDVSLNPKSVFSNSKNSNFIEHKNSQPQTVKNKTMQSQLEDSSYIKSSRVQNVSNFPLKQQTSQYEQSPPPSPKQFRRKQILPITDQGQDGLKIIRRNLLRKRTKPRVNPKSHSLITHTQIDSARSDEQQVRQKSIDEIKDTIKDIANIIKSNRNYVSNFHRRVHTNPNILPDVQQPFGPASRTIQKSTSQHQRRNVPQRFERRHILIGTPTIRLNMEKLKKNNSDNPEELLQKKRKLMQLSEVFD